MSERATRDFHAARWSEPMVMELGSPGERGVALPAVEPEVREAVGDPLARLPAALRRAAPPNLPEVSQPVVLRHYLRLSQMCLGNDLTPDVMGTCTMKYSPKVNEAFARMPEVADLHPLQDPSTMRGILELAHRFERILCEVSGLDAFTFQPGGGAQGIYTNACLIRAYHRSRGEADRRDEIITTAFSHPSDAATPAVAGFRVITLMPGPLGYPELDALKSALSKRTAGLMMTNPEDTGLFNPHAGDFVRLVHEAGGLCAYDQANANGVLGISRAGDVGFDLCQFNLHKTFASPHAAIGPACGAVGVRRELARFLPTPVIVAEDGAYRLDHDRPESIGKIRSFLGNLQVVVRAYAWVMALGADGLRAVAETAVLNNRYLQARLAEVPGVGISYPEGGDRVEQVRYHWQRLQEETGVDTEAVKRRLVDFGFQNYFTAHHPVLVAEPFTLEPGETPSKADLDEYAAAFHRISDEAHAEPETVRTAPHRSTIRRIDESAVDDPARWALTWRAWKRKHG